MFPGLFPSSVLYLRVQHFVSLTLSPGSWPKKLSRLCPCLSHHTGQHAFLPGSLRCLLTSLPFSLLLSPDPFCALAKIIFLKHKPDRFHPFTKALQIFLIHLEREQSPGEDPQALQGWPCPLYGALGQSPSCNLSCSLRLLLSAPQSPSSFLLGASTHVLFPALLLPLS